MKQVFILLALIMTITSCTKEFNGPSPEDYVKQKGLNATELDNGVFIVIHEEGNDVKPGLDDGINVDYRGILADNDFTFDDKEGFQAVLGNLIAGWYVGLREIGEGGSATLIIPPSLAFGNNDIGNIPGKSTVVYEIELNHVYKPTTVEGYIERNNLETTELDKGVHIVIEEEGNSVKPMADNDIRVTYTGKFTNERVFDQGEDVSFNLANLIEGWQIGLAEIGVGGKCLLVIPYEVAYGENGNQLIPPMTPLVFEIELLGVGTLADQYVLDNNLMTTRLSEGVHIIIDDAGDDNKPSVSSEITVKYEGRLTDGTVFDANEEFTTILSNLITGWRIGLMEIGVGGKCTLIIPPSAGYGSSSIGDIPANSVLIFDIELNGVQ